VLRTDGKNIKFTEMGDKFQGMYNFAPTFCRFVPGYAADMLHKDYHKVSSRSRVMILTFDLAGISLHNGIEHD
ncbi:aromatic peroxygenase, partial [Mycena pura]